MSTDSTGQSLSGGDFFAGDAARGLERMRLRLLDLTNRNRLINFRHTKRSSLQIVDAVPESVFRQLADGDEFSIVPVPDPPRGRAEHICQGLCEDAQHRH